MNIYIDIETAGLDYRKNGIIDISYIIVNTLDEVVRRNTITINPSYKPKCSKKALEINGYTVKDIVNHKDAELALEEFHEDITTYYKGKYQPIAYNAEFDKNFLIELYSLYKPDTYYKHFSYKWVCPYHVVLWLQHLGKINTGYSQTLTKVCKYFNIPITEHKSSSDIEATRILCNKLKKFIK